MTREELIEALEKAERPSSDLDGAILLTTREGEASDPVVYAQERAKRFTASLDAAITLVPDDGYWIIERPHVFD